MTHIDWVKIGEAVSFYKACGYTYIDVPWRVDIDSIKETIDEPSIIKTSNGLGLIGSAEQSFIYLTRQGLLRPGRYVSCTPCFRVEPEYNNLSKPEFMKVELFDSSSFVHYDLTMMISKAGQFFSMYTKDVELVKTLEGYDYVLNGIEIGSYGLRYFRDTEGVNNFSWNYGTGLAEPRFSTALET